MHCFFHAPSLAPASAHRHGGKADRPCNDRPRLTACPDKNSVQFFQAPANRRACDSFFTRLRSVVVFFCMSCPEELLSHSTSSSCLFYARRMLVQSRIRLCMFGHFQHSQAAGASPRYHSAQHSHSVLSVNTSRSSHPISNAIALALSAQLTNAAATVNSTLATPPPSPPAHSPAALAPVPATSLSTPTHSSTARSSLTNSSVNSMNSPPGLLKPSSSRSSWQCPSSAPSSPRRASVSFSSPTHPMLPQASTQLYVASCCLGSYHRRRFERIPPGLIVHNQARSPGLSLLRLVS